MPLPAPDLDDRRFQDLVDEAKRMVQQRCPDWTDHNVSDPGVTLIELFAWMTEQVVYRLNRVPDKLYTTFLNLLGVSTYPATAASVQQTFWLSAPQPAPIVVPSGTQVATPRVPGEDPIVFTTTTELVMPSVELLHLRAAPAHGNGRDLRPLLRRGDGVAMYSELPAAGDALLLGLSEPVPSCAVTLSLDCSVRGVGVDPDDPPVVWEAFDGDNWSPCEVESDSTRGFNHPGAVLLHVPADHRSATIGRARGGWIRARLVPVRQGQPEYSESPVIRQAAAAVIGATVHAVHAERILDEVVGTCLGLPGDRMTLQRTPLVPGDEPPVVEVAEPEATGTTAWVPWQIVPDFGDSIGTSRHVTLDTRSGELAFGPAVRDETGGLRRYGRVPPQGAAVRIREYRTGGGAAGNVSANALVVLTSSLPYIGSVANRQAASGGRDAESLENAKTRGPVALRHRGRAVTVEDFEVLALEAAPEVARVRAVAAGDGADAGGVRVLVVPSVSAPDGRLEFGQMVPAEATLRRIAETLDSVRVLATRLVVEPPKYQGITVIARLRAVQAAAPTSVEADVLTALHRWFDPVSGGPTGDGWPFGRAAHVGEVYGVLQRVPGVDLVEEVRLYAADPVENVRGKAAQRIELDPNALVFSYDHQVKVLPAWGGDR